MGRGAFLGRAASRVSGVLGRTSDDAARKAASTNSAWASAAKTATLGTAGIIGGSKAIGGVSDAYEQRAETQEAQARQERADAVLNDPTLSEEQKAAILEQMGDESGSGLMTFLDNLSITQAAMLIAFAYLGLRAVSVLSGVYG